MSLATLGREVVMIVRRRVLVAEALVGVGAVLASTNVAVRQGRWTVGRARLSRAGFGFARVWLVTDEGARGRATVTAAPRGFLIDGQPAEVLRSRVCGGKAG